MDGVAQLSNVCVMSFGPSLWSRVKNECIFRAIAFLHPILRLMVLYWRGLMMNPDTITLMTSSTLYRMNSTIMA